MSAKLYQGVLCPHCDSDKWGCYDSDCEDGGTIENEYATCEHCDGTFTLKISRKIVEVVK